MRRDSSKRNYLLANCNVKDLLYIIVVVHPSYPARLPPPPQHSRIRQAHHPSTPLPCIPTTTPHCTSITLDILTSPCPSTLIQASIPLLSPVHLSSPPLQSHVPSILSSSLHPPPHSLLLPMSYVSFLLCPSNPLLLVPRLPRSSPSPVLLSSHPSSTLTPPYSCSTPSSSCPISSPPCSHTHSKFL